MKLGTDAAAAITGALLIDKPPGPTSHDVVAFVRRALHESRVGHTGTLDPLATGLLVILVGQATRMAQFLAADEKEYIADVRLGIATRTYDAQGLTEALGQTPAAELDPAPTRAEIDAVLDRFRGTFLQMPPPFSAKKIASVPAYELARKDKPVDLKPVQVTVRELDVLADAGPASARHPALVRRLPASTLLRLRVVSTAGFYVRSLAHDIGQALGCGAHLEALRRTRVGRFRVDEGLTLDLLEARGANAIIPLNDLIGHMPAVTLTDDGARRAAHGNALRPDHTKKGDSPLFSQIKGTVPFFVRLLDDAGTLLSVAERRADGLLHPLVVLG